MLRRSVRAAPLLIGALLAVSGCRDGAVDLGFRPDVGDRYAYRFEIAATVSRAIAGEEPEVTELQTVLTVRQEVVELTQDGPRVSVELRRDGGPTSTVVALLDRAGSLQGVELAEGVAEEALGADLAPPSLFGGVGLALPTERLRPGDRWEVESDERTGWGRLERLGVVDGEHVAVVRASSTDRVRDDLESGGSTVSLDGTTTARSTTSYAIGDGAIRDAVTSSRGEVVAAISPPEGVEADPVEATITYDLQVSITRLG